MRAVAASGVAQVAGVADSAPEVTRQALEAIVEHSPQAESFGTLEQMLESDLDGIVIATPSALHAAQAAAALSKDLSVFCQKPLARTAEEAASVLAAARIHDRLLSVDFCYRTLAGVPEMARLARSGALGEIYAADLVFHNAYGPDKPWFYDPRQSGGGCVMDLGIHLVDLLLWVLGYPQVTKVESSLYAGGRLLRSEFSTADKTEDYATAEVRFATGATARLACSWRLPAGRDAVIEAAFYGTKGAVILRNVNGSFYDFTVEHCEGTSRRVLAAPPDDWGGRAICEWARRVARDPRFDEETERLLDVSSLIDAIYGR
jgi:predicted dehydrogenase